MAHIAGGSIDIVGVANSPTTVTLIDSDVNNPAQMLSQFGIQL